MNNSLTERPSTMELCMGQQGALVVLTLAYRRLPGLSAWTLYCRRRSQMSSMASVSRVSLQTHSNSFKHGKQLKLVNLSTQSFQLTRCYIWFFSSSCPCPAPPQPPGPLWSDPFSPEHPAARRSSACTLTGRSKTQTKLTTMLCGGVVVKDAGGPRSASNNIF